MFDKGFRDVESLSSTQSPEFSSKYYINCYMEFQVSLGYMRSYFIYYHFTYLFVCLFSWLKQIKIKTGTTLLRASVQSCYKMTLYITLLRTKFKRNVVRIMQWQCQQEDSLLEYNELHPVALYYYIIKMDKNRPLSVCMVSFTRSLGKLYFYKSNLNLMQSAWWISKAEREELQ